MALRSCTLQEGEDLHGCLILGNGGGEIDEVGGAVDGFLTGTVVAHVGFLLTFEQVEGCHIPLLCGGFVGAYSATCIAHKDGQLVVGCRGKREGAG